MAEDNNQARQKQNIQKLLSGQSLSSSGTTTTTATATPTAVTSTSNPQPDVPSTTVSHSSPTETITTTPLREDKLAVAVSFLSSPKVQSADKSQKTAFLKQKGLTNPEIEEAYRRTSSTTSAQTAPNSSPVTYPATSKQASVTPDSTLPPVVPRRIPPTRPTQIVYYSPPDPERFTEKRILALALIFGTGAVALTAGLVSIVKVLISPIFNSITGYQRNRYNDRYDKLQRLSDTLRQQLVNQEEDGSLLADQQNETETATTRGYWSTLIKEQKSLMDRLDRLVGMSQKHVADEQEPYGKFKNTLLDLKEVLNRPEYNFSTYTPYSMYGSSTYANRSNTGFDDTAVQGVKSEIRSFKGMLLSRRNFPTAQIKPLPSVTTPVSSTTIATTIAKDNSNNNGGNDPHAATSASTTTTTTTTNNSTTTASYHPRQRQNSYRAELQAKAKAATAETTTDSQLATLGSPSSSQPDTGDDKTTTEADTKRKSTVIEDITETGAN